MKFQANINRVLFLAALLPASAFAAIDTPSYLSLSDIKAEKEGDRIILSLAVDPAKVNPGRDREVIFIPKILSGTDTLSFAPFAVAGRNRYYSFIRNGGESKTGYPVIRSGKGEVLAYTSSLPWEEWMSDSEIIMAESTQDCCRPVKPLTETPLATLSNPIKAWAMPVEPHYIAITDDTATELEAQGSAFIDFIVNRTEIRDNYRGNARELAKIIESVDRVKNDPDATITRLTIKGFASPEGSYDNNVRLAMGRTQALKEYVREHYNFDPELMHTDYEPEDWEGLRRWVVANEIPDRDAILGIIDSNLAPDPKNAEIQNRFPKTYKLLLDSVYPALRHSDYTVRYRIRTYISLEELKKAFAETPERLRPVDFFRIAESYPAGSPEAEEVLLKAAEIYPSDTQAAINASNILLRRGETAEAQKHLENVGESGEAYFSRGIAAAASGDYETALRYLETAETMGITEASSQVQALRTILSGKPEVTYLLTIDN